MVIGLQVHIYTYTLLHVHPHIYIYTDMMMYRRTELFSKLIIFAIEPFANTVNAHLFTM